MFSLELTVLPLKHPEVLAHSEEPGVAFRPDLMIGMQFLVCDRVCNQMN
jgi:hypothetical protein